MATLELVLEKLQVLLEKNEKLEQRNEKLEQVILEKNEKLEQVILEKNEKLEQKVSQLRAEVKYLSEKLDQQPKSSSPTAATATSTATVARWTGGELTPKDKKAIQKKSEFSCCRDNRMLGKFGQPRIACEYYVPYSRGFTRNKLMDEETGVYTTPIGGKYEFGFRATQYSAGVLKFFLVCQEMGWRHEILTTRKEKENRKEEEEEDYGTDDSSCDDDRSVDVTLNGTVVVDCKEFVHVTIEMVLVRGTAELEECCFSGKLIDFA